jgi:hypothetical protein
VCGSTEGGVFVENDVIISEGELYFDLIDCKIIPESGLIELLEEVEHAGVDLLEQVQSPNHMEDVKFFINNGKNVRFIGRKYESSISAPPSTSIPPLPTQTSRPPPMDSLATLLPLQTSSISFPNSTWKISSCSQ